MNKNNQNDFENQGWEAMLQTLDHEMPVEKKRRRFLWLVFFIGLTATLGGGFWYLNTKNPVMTLDKTISKPIVDIDLSKNDLSKNTVAEQNSDNIGKESEIVDLNKNIKAIQNKIIDNNKDNNDLSLNENINVIENKVTQINDSDLSLNENTDIIANGKDIKPIELLNKIKIAPLSIKQDSSELKYSYLYLNPLVCVTGNTIINNSEKLKTKLHFGITAGIHTEKGEKLDGFQAGLIVYKPLNRHWSLAAGLNFRQTQTSRDSISYFKREFLTTGAASTNLQSGTPISLDKLYYLELPLTIQYNFKKKFAFSTGLKTAYLVEQSVKENGASVYFVKSNFTSQNSFDLLNKVSTTTLGLNRWDVSLMGGFTYLPTKHIQLGLRYDLGLINIINRTNWSTYNRYLGLNAVYFF